MELPSAWQAIVGAELSKPYFLELAKVIDEERAAGEVFPPPEQVFAALEWTPFANVKAVILGQDPYHDKGQAHGLCFSVPPGVRPPPSLVNIFKELHADLGHVAPDHGCLVPWAQQGVLLLNTVLTVRAHEANSHRKKGWETFTDTIITSLSARPEPVIFVLWGGPAQKKKKLIDVSRHRVLEAAHPSPLSAHSGFFGSKPFSTINAILREWGQPEIDWRIPRRGNSSYC